MSLLNRAIYILSKLGKRADPLRAVFEPGRVLMIESLTGKTTEPPFDKYDRTFPANEVSNKLLISVEKWTQTRGLVTWSYSTTIDDRYINKIKLALSNYCTETKVFSSARVDN